MNPVGVKFVYSDLSMITLMFVVGQVVNENQLVNKADLNPRCMANVASSSSSASTASDANGAQEKDASSVAVAQCYYEAFVRIHVLGPLEMARAEFMPPNNTWAECAPTWNDTDGMSPGPAYRHRVIQGQVSDGNSYALGGIAGHAGLFAPIDAVMKLARSLLFPTVAGQPSIVNTTTISLFTKAQNLSQSSRALGWDTNDYTANDYRGCGNMSALTWTHTGYTGTQICCDPVNKMVTVLLTNRVYPIADEASIGRIHVTRQAFNNEALKQFRPGYSRGESAVRYATADNTPT